VVSESCQLPLPPVPISPVSALRLAPLPCSSPAVPLSAVICFRARNELSTSSPLPSWQGRCWKLEQCTEL